MKKLPVLFTMILVFVLTVLTVRAGTTVFLPHVSRFVYYESIKRELKTRPIYEYRCDERLKAKDEESTHLTDTGLVVELEHLKTKTRLKD
jgi:hypothetical protein